MSNNCKFKDIGDIEILITIPFKASRKGEAV